jgi:hypothetical protein
MSDAAAAATTGARAAQGTAAAGGGAAANLMDGFVLDESSGCYYSSQVRLL